MKKMLFSAIALVLVMGLMLTGCACNVNFGKITGPVVDREYTFTNFDSIEVSNAFEYEIYRSDSFKVTASIRESMVNSLDIHQEGQTVRIGLKPGSYFDARARAVISLPELKELVVSGASRGTVTGFNSGTDFKLNLSGASRIDMEMQTGDIEVLVSGASRFTGHLEAGDVLLDITGASFCELKGSASAVTVKATGASKVDVGRLIAQSADVSINSASRATVKTDGRLDISLSGASTLSYLGKPDLNIISITGASRLLNK